MMMNLRLLQISDSALPVGGYAHSWGLEAARARGLVGDAASLEQWTRNWLHYSLGPMEGVVVASVCRAAWAKSWSVLRQANDFVDASIHPPSLRSASREMGEQLLSLAAAWHWSQAGIDAFLVRGDNGPGRRAWHHAVIFGLLGALAESPPGETLAAYLHQATLAMIGAGVRSIPVGHTHGQQILAYLHDDIQHLSTVLADRELETAGSGCPFYEVLCDEQTRLYSRMFRS